MALKEHWVVTLSISVGTSAGGNAHSREREVTYTMALHKLFNSGCDLACHMM
jgi:hypothetical protein